MHKTFLLAFMLAMFIAVAAGCARTASTPAPAAQPAVTTPATTPNPPVSPAPPTQSAPAPSPAPVPSQPARPGAAAKPVAPRAVPASVSNTTPKPTAPAAPKRPKIQTWRVTFKGISRPQLSLVRQTLIGGEGIVSISDARAEPGLFSLSIKTTLGAGDLMGRLESIRNPRLEIVATDPGERVVHVKSAEAVY